VGTSQQNIELGAPVTKYFPISVRTSLISTAFFCCLLTPDHIFAQSYPGEADDVAGSIASTSLIIAQIRPPLFDDLPKSEAQIYKRIEFNVSDDSHHMIAYASKKNGVRRVTLSEGMGRTIELSADALMIEWHYNKPKFTAEYMNMVFKRAVRNEQKAAQGLAPERIPSPYDFAGWSKSDLEAFISDPQMHLEEMRLFEGAFSFVLAHEVAHHVLGHEDTPAKNDAEQRERETQADAWAIDLMVRKRISPVTGIIPMLLSYTMGLNPINREVESDHPADARRLLEMYEGLNKRLPEFKESIEESGQSYETVKKEVAQSLAMVRKEID
jgi:hypothetical protein